MSVAANPSARWLLAAVAAAAWAAPARAEDAPPPAPAQGAAEPAAAAETPEGRAERLRRARERWERMSPGEREGILRRFEEFRRLPPDRREELRRRLEAVGGTEGARLLRRKLEDARRSPEHMERVRVQAEMVRRIEERVVEGLPPRAAERWRTLPPEARARLLHRFVRRLLEAGREAVVLRLASAEERAALAAGDPAARRAALEALRRRIAEEVLAPRRAELQALAPAERRARTARLLEERFWEGVRERFAGVREEFLRALLEGRGGGGRNGPEGRSRFQEEFGVAPDALGPRWAAGVLSRVLRSLPPEGRAAFLADVRPELARIAALPAAEREPALRALLARLR